MTGFSILTKRFLDFWFFVIVFLKKVSQKWFLWDRFLKKFMAFWEFENCEVENILCLSILLKKTTFRRQNAQIIGKSGFRGEKFDLGGVPVFGTFWGSFCLCFAVFR
jgi:hypothetical protein